MKIAIQRGLSLIKGRLRLMNGFCPMCNSDAPELYDCPVCDGYQSARGDKYPPAIDTKDKRWNESKGAINAKAMVRRQLKAHRINKT